MQIVHLHVQVRSEHVAMESFQVTIVTLLVSLQIIFNVVVIFHGEEVSLMEQQYLLMEMHMEAATAKEEHVMMVCSTEVISTRHVMKTITILSQLGIIAMDASMETAEVTMETIKTNVSFHEVEVSLMVFL